MPNKRAQTILELLERNKGQPRGGPGLGRVLQAEVAHDVRRRAEPGRARADEAALVVQEGAQAPKAHHPVGAKPVVLRRQNQGSWHEWKPTNEANPLVFIRPQVCHASLVVGWFPWAPNRWPLLGV